MELGRADRAVLDRREKRLTVLGPGQQRLGGLVFPARRPAEHGVGMHEVEPLSRVDPGQQRAAVRGADRVPAHVRQHRCGQSLDDTRPDPAARRPLPVLVALSEQHLHTDADTEHRGLAGQAVSDNVGAADRAQAGHAGGERPDPGNDQAVGGQGRGPVGGHRHLGADPLQRAHRRAQVARSVIEHDDGRPRRAHSTPLVLGMPPPRGSGAAAARSARAKALNCASTMWCGFRP